MEEALQMDSVMERMLDFLPFQDLKNYRLVNKRWNKIAGRVLRKRALTTLMSNIHNADQFLQMESRLCYKSILAKVSGTLLVSDDERNKLYQSIYLNVPWMDRVKVLTLRGWSTDELNQVLPFLLYRLRSVEKLVLENMATKTKNLVIPEGLVSAVPSETALQLRFLHVVFQDLELDPPLDPGFLRQCPNLKVFSTDIACGAASFMDFANLWIENYSPALRVDHLIVNAGTSTKDQAGSRTEDYIQVVVDFITKNRPKSLQMDLPSNMSHRILKQAPARLPSVTKLALTEANWHAKSVRVFNWEETFKDISMFPGLRELHLEIRELRGELHRYYGRMPGYLKDFTVIKGLSALRVSILSQNPYPLSKNMALLSLFLRCQPHTALDLQIINARSRYNGLGQLLEPHIKAKLPVTEFKLALKKLEYDIHDDDSDDQNPEIGARRLNDADNSVGGKRAKLS